MVGVETDASPLRRMSRARGVAATFPLAVQSDSNHVVEGDSSEDDDTRPRHAYFPYLTWQVRNQCFVLIKQTMLELTGESGMRTIFTKTATDVHTHSNDSFGTSISLRALEMIVTK